MRKQTLRDGQIMIKKKQLVTKYKLDSIWNYSNT